MKIFFICDWDYALLWHPVAKKLKEYGFASECTALVVGKVFYEELISSNQGVFDRIYLMQEGTEEVPKEVENLHERISGLQNKYHEHVLWRYVWADRSWVKCGYEEIQKRLVVCFDYFEDLYSKESPDLILTNAYASMPHLISYEVAKKLKIDIRRPMSVRLNNLYILSDNEMEREVWIENHFHNEVPLSPTSREKVVEFIAGFREKNTGPAYQILRKKEHQVDFGHLYRFFRYLNKYFFTNAFKGDHTKANPFKRVWLESEWRLKRIYWLRSDHWDEYVPAEKYVYFPLHVQPEMSTMTFAPFYLDQPSIIENISKSLPIDYRLVIKEHPSMLGRRDGNYYRRIKSLPNVRFVSPTVNSFEITENSSAIFTITGTAGLEGLILRKPVFVLGSTFYRHCPLIINVGELSPTKWPEVVSQTLKSYEHDEETLIKFLGAIFERAFEGLYVEPLALPKQILAEENLDVLINQIINLKLENLNSD